MNALPNPENLSFVLLETLFRMGQAAEPADPWGLSRTLAVPLEEVARHLRSLEQDGLVDAARARLTMRGLVLAVSLASRGATEATPNKRTFRLAG